MATIQELFERVELNNADQIAALKANFQLIIDTNRVALECLSEKLSDLANIVSCPGVSDMVLVVDRSKLITSPPGAPGNDVFISDWLVSLFEAMSITQSGVNGSIYTYPKEDSDGSTLNNYIQNHSLTGNATALKVAANGYSIESVGDGRRPIDQAINAASVEILANGRDEARKIIVLLMTGSSNFLNGYGTVATDPVIAANNARNAGYEVYVIGVSTEVNPGEALAIAGGDSEYLFLVTEYSDLIYTIDSLKSKICVGSGEFVDCLPDDPVMVNIPQLSICEERTCCDEIL